LANQSVPQSPSDFTIGHAHPREHVSPQSHSRPGAELYWKNIFRFDGEG
jgi:hypothetical protein